MSRKEKINKWYLKTKKVIDRMFGSKSLEDVKEAVKITNKLSLEVICGRADDGSPYGVEVYAIKNGQAVDVEIIIITDDVEPGIKYLLNCYV